MTTHSPTTLIVRSGRNPHAISLAVGLAAISVYGLLFSPASVSIDSGLSMLERILFGIASMAGAALTLVGLHLRDAQSGLLVERVGQMLLAVGAIVYVIVLCNVSSFERSGLVTTIATAIAAGSTWRVWQITVDLRMFRPATKGPAA